MGQKVIFKKIYTQNLEFAEKGGKNAHAWNLSKSFELWVKSLYPGGMVHENTTCPF